MTVRPHRLHGVHRCDLLLQIDVVRSVVCVSVCVFGTRVNCEKTAEPIDAVRGLTHVGPRNQSNHLLDGGPDPPLEWVHLREHMPITDPLQSKPTHT